MLFVAFLHSFKYGCKWRSEDNHQSELAEELTNRKHLFCANPQTLHQTIANMDLNALVPYSPGDADMDFMDSILDFEV